MGISYITPELEDMLIQELSQKESNIEIEFNLIRIEND